MIIYNVYDHKNQLIGAHHSPSVALKQALIHQHYTGAPAYVESEVLCS
jgi:hypothetical protein